jgi:hypothetical protein
LIIFDKYSTMKLLELFETTQQVKIRLLSVYNLKKCAPIRCFLFTIITIFYTYFYKKATKFKAFSTNSLKKLRSNERSFNIHVPCRIKPIATRNTLLYKSLSDSVFSIIFHQNKHLTRHGYLQSLPLLCPFL